MKKILGTWVRDSASHLRRVALKVFAGLSLVISTLIWNLR